MHDRIFPTPYPFRVDDDRLVVDSVSFVQYMAAFNMTVLLSGLVLEEAQELRRIDADGVLHESTHFFA